MKREEQIRTPHEPPAMKSAVSLGGNRFANKLELELTSDCHL